MRSAESANSFGLDNGGPGSLGKLISAIHHEFKTVGERRAIHESKVLECRHHISDRGFHLLHLVAFTPEDTISIVPNAQQDALDADLRLVSPPDESHFLDGELFLLVAENNVLVCRSGLSEKALVSYIIHLAHKAGYENEHTIFELMKRADIDQLELINREGVRQVTMRSVAYKTSIDYITEQSRGLKVIGGIWNEMQTVFGLEHETDPRDADLKVEAIVKFDKRRGSEVSQRQIEVMAKSLINDDNDIDFTIETLSGKKIRAADMVLSKSVRLDQFGKSVHHLTAWGALQSYYRELSRST